MSEEPIVGPNRGNAGKGRPKGSQNKASREAKHAIALAADKLGGADRLVAWAKESEKNEASFWTTIYPKLIAVSIEGAGKDGEHLHEVAWRVVRA